MAFVSNTQKNCRSRWEREPGLTSVCLSKVGQKENVRHLNRLSSQVPSRLKEALKSVKGSLEKRLQEEQKMVGHAFILGVVT